MKIKQKNELGESFLPTDTKAFTLIELLTVIAIIGILAAILIPVVGAVRQSARQAQNTSNLREIGTALLLIVADEENYYPYGWDFANNRGWAHDVVELIIGNSARQNGLTVQHPVLLSPIEQVNHSGTIPSYTGPITNYSANAKIMGSSEVGPRISIQNIREPSGTFLVGDGLPREGLPAGATHAITWFINWVNVDDSPESAIEWTGGGGEPAFRNNGKASFVFVDGHVETLGPGEISHGHYSINHFGSVPESSGPDRPGR